MSHTEGIWKQQSERAPGPCKHGAWVLQSRERSGCGCNKSMLEILCPGCLLMTVSSCKLNNPQDNRSHPCHVTEEEVKTHLTHELWEPSGGAGHAERWEFRLKIPVPTVPWHPVQLPELSPQVLSAVTTPPFGS